MARRTLAGRYPPDASGRVTVVRMAEFAWSTMEPGRRIPFRVARTGPLISWPPPASPPCWERPLPRRPPGWCSTILKGPGRGRKRPARPVRQPLPLLRQCPGISHATRRARCSAMAEHFGANPHVIGWQIDNEYNRVCYCEQCQRHSSRQFLAEKYGSLEALNRTLVDALLEPDLFRLGADPHPGRPAQPRPDAGIQALRHRELPPVPAAAARLLRPHLHAGCLDHAQLHGLVRWLRPL